MTPIELLCAALNKLIWKCPTPERFRDDLHAWPEYWLGELRDGPDGCRIEGIVWDREQTEFKPAPAPQIASPP